MGNSCATLSSQHLLDYKNALEVLAKTKDSIFFSNEGAEHAALVMSTIFKYANNMVKIYATDMNGEISDYQEYQDSIKQFLERDSTTLQIILDKQPDDNYVNRSKILNILSDYSKNSYDKIQLKLANEDFKREMKDISLDGDKIYHFAIGDNRMVRVEADNITHEAPICSFNSPEYSNLLNAVFLNNFKNCTSVAL